MKNRNPMVPAPPPRGPGGGGRGRRRCQQLLEEQRRVGGLCNTDAGQCRSTGFPRDIFLLDFFYDLGICFPDLFWDVQFFFHYLRNFARI